MISITWRRNLVKSSDQKFLTLFQKIGDEKINLDCNPPSIFSILFLENEKQKIIGRKVSRNFRNEISPPIIRFLPVTRLEFAGPRGEREGKRREGELPFAARIPAFPRRFVRWIRAVDGIHRVRDTFPANHDTFAASWISSRILRLRRRDYVASPFIQSAPPGWLHPFGAVSTIGRPHFVRDWTEMGWLAGSRKLTGYYDV